MPTKIFSIKNILITLILLVLLFVFVNWQNNGIRVSRYEYENKKLPKGFSGFKVVLISDYHNYKKLEKKTLELTKSQNPDIIAVTGDLIDSRNTDIPAALKLLEGLLEIAPVYYVTGNHESRMENPREFLKAIEDMGATVLKNESLTIEKNGDKITVLGVHDPGFFGGEVMSTKQKEIYKKEIERLGKEGDNFRLLLTHRPEFMEDYSRRSMDLVLCGHAHGGQFSIPFTDIGVFVPSQGFFPAYGAGEKKKDNTAMIISRGIGNSVFPLRLFNRPQVICVEFK